jgi:hypothetical protein
VRRASNDDWLRDEATFYYATTAYECAWTYRRTLRRSARNFWLRGVFPFIGAVAMTWAFVQSATDMYAPDYGKTHFGPVGGRIRPWDGPSAARHTSRGAERTR